MLVRDCMSRQVVSVRPESDPLAAVAKLKSFRCRRLPVVDEEERVLGIVTRSDLERFLASAPSPGVMKRQHRVDQVMSSPVVTVPPDYPLEEAARLMVQHKIGALPVVVEGGRLVGIITETDIFERFVRILGGDSTSLRVTVGVPNVPGELARLAGRVAEVEGNISSIVAFPSDRIGRINITLRIQGLGQKALLEAMTADPDVELLHVWSGGQD